MRMPSERRATRRPGGVCVSSAERTPRALRGSDQRAGQLTITTPAIEESRAIREEAQSGDRTDRRGHEDDGAGLDACTCASTVASTAAATSRRSRSPSVASPPDAPCPRASSASTDSPWLAERLGERNDLGLSARRAEPVNDHHARARVAAARPALAVERHAVRRDDLERGRVHAAAAARIVPASSARHTTRSGSHGSRRLYSRGDPSMRDACRPAAAATATGAAESHSY